MKKLFTILACVLALVLCFSACAPAVPAAPEQTAQGGVLRLSVNPEIAVFFDENGNVTKVDARNDDGSKIIADYTGFEGKATKTVVAELVTTIGEAGYFVEELDGSRRHITLEIEPGSRVPSEAFLTEVEEEVRKAVDGNNWTAPVATENHGGRTCTNPDCTEWDCDDLYCDNGVCTNPYCDEWDCDDKYCDENVPRQTTPAQPSEPAPTQPKRICTNPDCTEWDCDDVYCDNGICTNPDCTDQDCDDKYCDNGVCTNPDCTDQDCDDKYCDNGTCTNPYCDDRDCDDKYCDEGPGDDDDDDRDDDDRFDD